MTALFLTLAPQLHALTPAQLREMAHDYATVVLSREDGEGSRLD